jgi:hypothetical protein
VLISDDGSLILTILRAGSSNIPFLENKTVTKDVDSNLQNSLGPAVQGLLAFITCFENMSKSSDDKNNITKEGVSNDYSSAIKNGDKSQQIPTENIQSIQEQKDISNKIFEEAKSNNFIISEEQHTNTLQMFLLQPCLLI